MVDVVVGDSFSGVCKLGLDVHWFNLFVLFVDISMEVSDSLLVFSCWDVIELVWAVYAMWMWGVRLSLASVVLLFAS